MLTVQSNQHATEANLKKFFIPKPWWGGEEVMILSAEEQRKTRGRTRAEAELCEAQPGRPAWTCCFQFYTGHLTYEVPSAGQAWPPLTLTLPAPVAINASSTFSSLLSSNLFTNYFSNVKYYASECDIRVLSSDKTAGSWPRDMWVWIIAVTEIKYVY